MRAVERDMRAILFWLMCQQVTEQTVSWSACRAHFRSEMCQARFEIAWKLLKDGGLIQKLPFNGSCCPVVFTLEGRKWMEKVLLDEKKVLEDQQGSALLEVTKNMSLVSRLPQSTLKLSLQSEVKGNRGNKNGF